MDTDVFQFKGDDSKMGGRWDGKGEGLEETKDYRENYLLRESLIIRDKRIPWMMPRAVLEASIYVEGKWDRCTIPSVAEMTLNFRMSVSGVVPLPFSSIYKVNRRCL